MPMAVTRPMTQALTSLRRRPGAVRLVIVFCLIVLWEIAARWILDPLFIAPPTRVIASIDDLLAMPNLPAALGISFVELAVAFVLSILIGLPLGLMIGLSPVLKRSMMPIVFLLYGIPQVTILPLFILFLGIGPPAKIAYGVSHGFFPIVVTVAAAVQTVKPIILTSMRSMGATRAQIFRWVIFPHILPSFFTGMRLAMTAVLIGVLLAELYVSSAGIGFFTRRFTETFNPTMLFALVTLMAAMAILLNEIMRRAEAHFSRWRTLQN